MARYFDEDLAEQRIEALLARRAALAPAPAPAPVTGALPAPQVAAPPPPPPPPQPPPPPAPLSYEEWFSKYHDPGDGSIFYDLPYRNDYHRETGQFDPQTLAAAAALGMSPAEVLSKVNQGYVYQPPTPGDSGFESGVVTPGSGPQLVLTDPTRIWAQKLGLSMDQVKQLAAQPGSNGLTRWDEIVRGAEEKQSDAEGNGLGIFQDAVTLGSLGLGGVPGALLQAGYGVAQGQDPAKVLQNAAIAYGAGQVVGASGLGDAAGGGAAGSTVEGAASGALKSAAAGGDVVTGALSGAASGGIKSDAVTDVIGNTAAGALSGATTAAIRGGDAVQGALTGAVTPAINDLAKLPQEPVEEQTAPADAGGAMDQSGSLAVPGRPDLGTIFDHQGALAEPVTPTITGALSGADGATPPPVVPLREPPAAEPVYEPELVLASPLPPEPDPKPAPPAAGDESDDELERLLDEEQDTTPADSPKEDASASGTRTTVLNDDATNDLVTPNDGGGEKNMDEENFNLDDILDPRTGDDGSYDEEFNQAYDDEGDYTDEDYQDMIDAGGGFADDNSILGKAFGSLKSLGSAAGSTIKAALGGDAAALKKLAGLGVTGGLLASLFENPQSPLVGPVKQGVQGALDSADAFAKLPAIGLTGSQKAAIKLANEATGNWKPSLDKAGSLIDKGSGATTAFQPYYDKAGALTDSGTAPVTAFQPYYDKAGALTDKATAGITPEQIARYQNPYLRGVLDPQLRDITEAADKQRQKSRAMAAMSGNDTYGPASGPTRFNIEDELVDREMLRAVGDASGKAYSDSYNSATGLATNDLNRYLTGANVYNTMGTSAGGFQSKDLERDLAGANLYGTVGTNAGGFESKDLSRYLDASQAATNIGKTRGALDTLDFGNLQQAGALERLPQEDARTQAATASKLYSAAAGSAAGAIPVTTPRSKLTSAVGALGGLASAKQIGLY